MDGVESSLVESLQGLLRETLVLIDVRCVRSNLLLRQITDNGAELLVLLWQLERRIYLRSILVANASLYPRNS